MEFFPSEDRAFGIWTLNQVRNAVRSSYWPYKIPADGDKYSFSATGSLQSLSLPASASQVTIKAWGGSGGSTTRYGTYYGGAGGFSQGTFPVNGGDVLKIVVGEGGKHPDTTGSYSTFGGGGEAGTPHTSNVSRRGAGGGGYSGVFVGSVSQSNALVIAGGGGGTAWGWGGDGGSGGYPEGLKGGFYGSDGSDAGGKGGDQTSGGQEGFGGRDIAGFPGSALQGGDTPEADDGDSSGAGGGGYYGGGGAGLSYGGGGGGSSYAASNGSNVIFLQVTQLGGDASQPLTPDDLDYIDGVGVANEDADGSPGLVVVFVT